MIWRQFNASSLNRIANDPDVRPMMGGQGDMDFTGFLADRRNIALQSDGGCGLFDWSGPGIYQMHTMWMPEARGKKARSLIGDMVAAMFDAHGARLIWAQTPMGHRPVRMLARLCGFKSEGFGEHMLIGPVEYFIKENG